MRLITVSEEKRKMERFELEVFSTIRVGPKGHHKDTIELCSKNICSEGAYFETSKLLPVGTPVALSIKLKVNNKLNERNNQVAIEVTGKVIRSEKDGMAIKFDNDFKMLPLGNNNKLKKKK